MSEYEDNYNGTAIHLIDGRTFDFNDPTATDFDLHTVAHGLARESRYGGHYGADHYSVAEHAVIVSYLVSKFYNSPELALAALHHDDDETVLKDLPTPFKNWLKQFIPLEWATLKAGIMAKIAEAFEIDPADFESPIIHEADVLAYAAEIVMLKPAGHGALPEVEAETLAQVSTLIQAMPAGIAEQNYVMRHEYLTHTGHFSPEAESQREASQEDPDKPIAVKPDWDDGNDPFDPRSN